MSNEANIPTAPEAEPESVGLPIGGGILREVLANFAAAPAGNDAAWPICSVGVGQRSMVATDTRSAIVVGEQAPEYWATQRPEADIAAFSAKRYKVAANLGGIARLTDPKTGDPVPMPDVVRAIRNHLGGMRALAIVNPSALVAVGKVAKAFGAEEVELFVPSTGETKALGFRLTVPPDARFVDLFNMWEGDLSAMGVFMVTHSNSSSPMDEADDEEFEAGEGLAPEPAARAKSPAKPARATVEIVAPIEAPEPEPVVDTAEARERGAYRLPPLSTLQVRLSERTSEGVHREGILQLLRENNLTGRIDAWKCGPTVTRYELTVPGTVKVARIVGLADDLMLQLGVKSVRVQPIPGTKAIGVEVPNPKPRTVGLLDLCARAEFVDAAPRLKVALGEDVGGRPVYADLATMPHLLVGGATNSGKSIGVASILASLLLRNTPKDLRLVMIDPKQVELALFDRIPHLMCPVITDVKEAAGVLRAVVREMERRYGLLKDRGVRNLDGWNAKASENESLPCVVVVIDELADLMLQVGAEVEDAIVRLAQKARAVGIHLVVATQRPSVDIVTGLIKANVPSRIAFAVASGVDSKVILDSTGAERLIGRGDMLFNPIDSGGQPARVQGAYVSEDEVGAICRHWREQASPQYEISLDEDGDAKAPDPFPEAARWAAARSEFGVAELEAALLVNRQRAIVLLGELASAGVIDDMGKPRPRVLMDSAQAEAMLEARRG